MDTTTDINLIKVDKYGRPLEDKRNYLLTSFLYDIKRNLAELRFAVGICNKLKNGESEWVQPNRVWVICIEHCYSKELGWHNEKVYYMGGTKRDYKEINELLGYCAIDSYNTYL